MAGLGTLLLTAGFVAAALAPLYIIYLLFAPRRPNPVKNETFECGQPPSGSARVHLFMQYYPFLLMYLVLDVTTLFLYAWSLSGAPYSPSSLLLIYAFLGALLLPIAYTLKLSYKRELW
ncbi:MAG: NADH-quinone oxidoreductase subunit A [Nitrososphaerota archaeon]